MQDGADVDDFVDCGFVVDAWAWRMLEVASRVIGGGLMLVEGVPRSFLRWTALIAVLS